MSQTRSITVFGTSLRWALTWAVSAAVLTGPVEAQTGPFEIEVEGGAVWQSRNDAEIPNDGSATRFSLADLAGKGAWPAGRLYLTWHLSERHALRLLWAPLSITEFGTPASPIDFAGSSFGAGVPLDASYVFNSYRLTYRWRFHSGPSTAAWLGFTAKVRDASVRLTQGAVEGRKDDLGFVPLLHLAGAWRAASRWSASADVDALAGGPGRAIDGALKIGYHPSDRWSIHAGYRTVEGGADVASVYNFAWLHYAVASVSWRW